MNVSDMLELSWDDTLTQMASNYLKTCNIFQKDECTSQNIPVSYANRTDLFIKGTNAYLYISQNRYCYKAKFFPPDIIQRSLRDWYLQKSLHKQPKVTKSHDSNEHYGTLKFITNFTHLVHSLTHKFGCAISRYANLCDIMLPHINKCIF